MGKIPELKKSATEVQVVFLDLVRITNENP